MAFFSEIKARLGLDISPFEKGLSQAQGSLGKVVDGATGKLANLKNVGTTLATALGLNLQTIAEGVARMVVGFSKDQEDALLKLAARSAAVADEMEKRAKQRRGDDDPEVRVVNLQNDLKTQRKRIEQNPPLTEEEKSARFTSAAIFTDSSRISRDIQKEEEKRAKARADANAEISKIDEQIRAANDQIRAKTATLNKDTAKTEEEARKKILRTDEKIAEARAKIAEPAPAATGNKDIDDLKIAQQANDKAKARADLLDLEKEKEDKINTLAKDTAKVREDALDKTLTLEEQILAAKDKVNESELAAYESKAGIERANAEFTLAQDRAKLAELEGEKSKKQTEEEKRQQAELDADEKDFTDKQAAAEKKRTDELKNQQKTLQDQKKTVEQTLAAQAKASLLPSMADVVSGKRNIGGVARGRATQLERDRAKVLELSDAEQRAREEFASGEKTGGIYNPEGISSAKFDHLTGGISSIMGETALEKGRRIRGELDQTRARITTNENLLGSRISDANPNAKMEEELMQIKTELRVLNYTTLAPQNTK